MKGSDSWFVGRTKEVNVAYSNITSYRSIEVYRILPSQLHDAKSTTLNNIDNRLTNRNGELNFLHHLYSILSSEPPPQLLFRSPSTKQIITNKYILFLILQAKKCNEAALSLLVCMEKTDCVMKKKKSLEECMKSTIDSDPCLAVRNAYYNCKHSQLNMRTRIRGVRQY